MVTNVPGRNLVIGQVKILKRGEALSLAMNDERVVGDRKPRKKSMEYTTYSDLVLGSTDRLGLDPETVQKQIKSAGFKVMDAIYAGSGSYYTSPPPSSVPLPAFLAKNNALNQIAPGGGLIAAYYRSSA